MPFMILKMKKKWMLVVLNAPAEHKAGNIRKLGQEVENLGKGQGGLYC